MSARCVICQAARWWARQQAGGGCGGRKGVAPHTKLAGPSVAGRPAGWPLCSALAPTCSRPSSHAELATSGGRPHASLRLGLRAQCAPRANNERRPAECERARTTAGRVNKAPICGPRRPIGPPTPPTKRWVAQRPPHSSREPATEARRPPPPPPPATRSPGRQTRAPAARGRPSAAALIGPDKPIPGPAKTGAPRRQTSRLLVHQNHPQNLISNSRPPTTRPNAPNKLNIIHAINLGVESGRPVEPLCVFAKANRRIQFTWSSAASRLLLKLQLQLQLQLQSQSLAAAAPTQLAAFASALASALAVAVGVAGRRGGRLFSSPLDLGAIDGRRRREEHFWWQVSGNFVAAESPERNNAPAHPSRRPTQRCRAASGNKRPASKQRQLHLSRC